MKKFIAIIFIFIFLILTPPVVVLHSFKSRAFESDFYKQELVKHDIYNLALDETFTKFFESEDSKFSEEIPFLTDDDLKNLIKSVITPAWLQSQTEMFIDELSAWFMSDKDIREIKLVIKLGDMKNQSLTFIKSKIEEKFITLPICSVKDIEKFKEISIQNLPSCRPPDFTADNLFKEFDISKILEQVPDEIDLVRVIQGEPLIKGDEAQNSNFNSEQLFENLTKIRTLAHIIFSAIDYMFIILGLMLIFITVLAMSSMRSMLRWAGFTVFILGIILIFIPITLHIIYNNFIVKQLEMPELSIRITQTIKSLISDSISYFFRDVYIYAIIALVLGIVLIVLLFIRLRLKRPLA